MRQCLIQDVKTVKTVKSLIGYALTKFLFLYENAVCRFWNFCFSSHKNLFLLYLYFFSRTINFTFYFHCNKSKILFYFSIYYRNEWCLWQMLEPSSCQRFIRKFVAPGEIAPVKCLNCDCFQYQHDWLATWDQGSNTHRILDSNKYSNNSSTTSRLPSTHYQTPSARDANKKLNTEVCPFRPPTSRPLNSEAPSSTQCLGGGHSLAKQKA